MYKVKGNYKYSRDTLSRRVQKKKRLAAQLRAIIDAKCKWYIYMHVFEAGSSCVLVHDC